MSLDLATVVPLVVSILGALGVGSVIGQWAAGGKDRRAARAGVLEKLAAVESARWCEDGPEADSARLISAIRQLETAALIARVPRSTVIPYCQLATAGLWMMQDELDRGGDLELTGLSSDVSDSITDAAEIISRAAWSPRTFRWVWLPLRLRARRRAMASLDNSRFQSKVMRVQHSLR